jgi:UDPglucose--hexose-1-phosphate uridylyltransferase
VENSTGGPEFRHNAISGEWVVLASGRGIRPHSAGEGKRTCPFCAGNESLTPPTILEVKEGGPSTSWFVRVVENLFPIAGPTSESSPAAQRKGRFRSVPVAGAHEVVIETPFHDQEMASRASEQLLLSLQAWQARSRELLTSRGIRYVVIFKNRGVEAGTSLEHPHSQIVALRKVPEAVLRRLRAARRHFKAFTSCLVCDDAQAERSANERVIFEDEGFIAYVPFAASFAGQVRLVPLDHSPSFAALHEAHLAAMGSCLRRLLVALDAAFGRPAFNLILVTAPKPWHEDPALHWYVELVPRLGRAGGFELATGTEVDTLAPDAAAKKYLAALPQ